MVELRAIRTLSRAALEPLLAASAAEGFRFVARLVADWESGQVRFDAPGEVLLGAYDGERLVAVGGLTRSPFAGSARVGRLRRIYVLPALRGHGIGRQLVHALEAHAIAHHDALELRTDTAAAARFYEALGYTAVDGYDTVTHRRTLGPASGSGGSPNANAVSPP